MPAVQTAYEQYHSAYQLGQVGDTTSAVIVSRLVETDGGIGFAQPVFAGVADRSCIAAPAAPDMSTFEGITVAGIFGDPALLVNNQTVDAYQKGSEAKVLEIGVVVVEVASDVVFGQPVAINASGAFVADSGDGVFAVPRAKFLESAASGSLVPVEIR